MREYGESKTARIMMATVPHVTSSSGLRNFRPMDFCSTECSTRFNIQTRNILPTECIYAFRTIAAMDSDH